MAREGAAGIKAIITLKDGSVTTGIAVNPGRWFGKTHVFQVAIANALNPFVVVEGDTAQDALDEWADSKEWGHLINIDEKDVDLENEDIATAGNDSHQVNLDNVGIETGAKVSYVLHIDPEKEDQLADAVRREVSKFNKDNE